MADGFGESVQREFVLPIFQESVHGSKKDVASGLFSLVGVIAFSFLQ